MEEPAAPVPEAPARLRIVPLRLAPLLAPYKKLGRLSLRIERMPQLARLSAGRNRGDGSWSLGPDELEDLTYLFPEGVDEAHALAIRVISLDADTATTVAVLDFHIPAGGTGLDVQPSASATGPGADVFIQRLREELASTRAALAASESELASAREAATREATPVASRNAETELATARAAWKVELDQRLAAAAAQAASDLQEAERTWKAGEDARMAVAATQAASELRKAEQAWKAEEAARMATAAARAEADVQNAERVWKAGEAARLAHAEAQWQAKSRKGSPTAPSHHPDDMNEIARLREQLAALQTSIGERDAVLAKMEADAEDASMRSAREAQDGLLRAKQTWRNDEAARLAAMQAEWEEKSEAALAEVRAEVASLRGRDAETERRAMREKLAAAQATLAERETALATARLEAEAALSDARAEADAARRQWQRESEAALAKAQNDWKADTATKLVTMETQLKGEFAKALADATARHEQAEASLMALRAKVDTDAAVTREQGDSELRLLRDKTATLEALLKTKDAELARTRDAAEQARATLQQRVDATLADARATLQQRVDATLADAKAAWEAETAARVATTQGDARKDSSTELNIALARAEAAETQLAQMRIRASATRERSESAEVRRLEHEREALQAELAKREMEILQLRGSSGQSGDQSNGPTFQDGKIVLRTNQAWEALDRGAEAPPKRTGRRVIGGLVMAAALGAAALVLYPNLSGNSPAPATKSVAAAAATAEAQPMAVVLRDGNLRASPSTGASIVAKIRRGLEVTALEHKGSWMRVRIAGESGNAAPREGWVHNSLLKTSSVPKPPPAKPAID